MARKDGADAGQDEAAAAGRTEAPTEGQTGAPTEGRAEAPARASSWSADPSRGAGGNSRVRRFGDIRFGTKYTIWGEAKGAAVEEKWGGRGRSAGGAPDRERRP